MRDLDKRGAVLDAAISLGAKSIHSVQFSIDEPRELAWGARQEAIADASTKAQHLARLNDVNAGSLVDVSQVVGSRGGYHSSNFSQENAPPSNHDGGVWGPSAPADWS